MADFATAYAISSHSFRSRIAAVDARKARKLANGHGAFAPPFGRVHARHSSEISQAKPDEIFAARLPASLLSMPVRLALLANGHGAPRRHSVACLRAKGE